MATSTRQRPSPTAKSTEPVAVSMAEAMQIAQASSRTIRRWIAEGLIRAGRPMESGSSRLLINRADLLRHLGIEGW